MGLKQAIRRNLRKVAASVTGKNRRSKANLGTGDGNLSQAIAAPPKTMREGNAEISERALMIRTFKMEVYQQLAESTILSKLGPLLKDTRVALDVGGNVGHIAFFLSKHAEKVYTFEAVDAVFQQLEKVTQRAPNVIPERCAISNFCGEADFFVDHNRLSNSGLHHVGDVDVSFKPKTEFKTKKTVVKSIDSMQLENVGFIKIDVEGSELDVLKGAEETISKNHPDLLVEIFEPFCKYPARDIFEFCIGHGYDCFYYNSQLQTLEKASTIEECLAAVATKHHLHDGDFLFTRKQVALQAAA